LFGAENDMSRREKRTVFRDEIRITGEAEYIIRKAQKRDARVVTLGNIAFFSTETADAWMLDPEDGLALCLVRDGARQEYSILETDSSFQIGWNAQYEIQKDAFVVATADGRVRTITGYPTEEIARAIRGGK
jgi:hypothetical protein